MIEPQEVPPARDSLSPDVSANTPVGLGRVPLDEDELNKRLFAMARAACSHAETSDLSKRRSAMARSNRSFANEHSEGSKYKHKNYSSRSKLHIPKTRSAVKNKQVAAHAALFGTDDVVAISAEDDSDPGQQASAELNKALLNYRLDRTNYRSGTPWYRIANGAVVQATVCGICVSKQYWQFKEVLKEVQEDFDPADPMLDHAIVGMNGRPMRRKVLRDRPMIEPQAPENVIVDMAAPWWDVVQEGSFFIVKMAMRVGDVKAMMKPGAQHLGGGPWFNIPDKVMSSAVTDGSQTSVRTSRNQGSDRYSRTSSPPVDDFQTIWVHENFIRYEDCDYHFWTLGTKQLLSEPGEVGTKGHYPAHHGERPYVMGVGSIEPDNALPMSHVESWRPLQDEINDTRNLRLDTMKQSIAPIAIYRRGANVDLRAVRERGPDATIQVSDLEKDLKFERATGPDASSYAETDRLNSEFDELAGSFATSTVGSSRALGETARGMQLVSSSAATVQEFDLQVFLQTWAEPVLRHVVWLEQYYETDEVLLGLMAKKANLFQRFGTDQKLDELLEREVTVKVNLGPGAGDPNQKMARLNAAFDMVLKIAPSLGGQVKPKGEDIVKIIMEPTGVAAERLFDFISPEEAEAKRAEQPDPEAMKVQAQTEIEGKKLQLEEQKQQIDVQLAQEKNALEREKLEMERAKVISELQRADQETQFKAADMQRADQEMTLKTASAETDRQMREREFSMGREDAAHSKALAVAGHNKQMLEAPPSQEGVTDPASAMQEAVGQFQQIMVSLAQSQQAAAQSQQETTQQIALLAQGQQDTSALLREMIAFQRAPRRIVRDASGRVAGVQIGDEVQPVMRGPDDRIEGM